MAKLKELIKLAEILGERLRDKNPDEKLILMCLEPLWPYIYPYGLLSYLKEHAEVPPEKTDRLKLEKLTRAVTGSRRRWRSFILGLCHTYRERHSLARTRTRLVRKAAGKGAPLTAGELEELAEGFREQALLCARAIEEARLELFSAGTVVGKIKLANSIRNEENIPRFLRFCRYLNCEEILKMVPEPILEEFRKRYQNPTAQTLAFDALQEYVVYQDPLWKQFKDMLLGAYRKSH